MLICRDILQSHHLKSQVLLEKSVCLLFSVMNSKSTLVCNTSLQEEMFEAQMQYEQEMQAQAQAERESAPGFMQTVSMPELYEMVYPGKPPIIDHFLYPGTYLFVGAPKVGKSFMMAQIAYHVSSATPMWNYSVSKGTVLYLALEDDYRRLQERLYRMFSTETTPDLFFSVASKSLNEGLLDQLDTDALTVTHNTPDAEPSVTAFNSDHIKYHLHYSAEYRPARLKSSSATVRFSAT